MTADRNQRRRPGKAALYGAVAVAGLFWALNGPIGKIGFRYFPPVLFFMLRVVIAGLLMNIVLALRGVGLRSVRREDRLKLPALMLFGHVGNQLGYLLGLSRTSIAHSSIVYATLPITILFLAVLCGQEKLRKARLLGMAVSAVGVVVLGFDRGSRIPGEAPTLIGDLLTFAATIGFACVTVFGREFRKRYPPELLLGVAYTAGALAAGPALILSGRRFDFSAVPAGGWLALLVMAAGSAVTSYLLYFWALGYLEASVAAVVQYLETPLAVLIAAVFMGEPVTAAVALGGSIVLAGVYFAERA